jgi:hypothetical protein
MTAKKVSRICRSIATSKLETKFLSISIRNEDGVHFHERNGEKFQGKQKECPLCASGSPFEQAMGGIGAE